MNKKCFKCGDEKEISAFYKHKGMSDGHLNKCKECCRLHIKNNNIMVKFKSLGRALRRGHVTVEPNAAGQILIMRKRFRCKKQKPVIYAIF